MATMSQDGTRFEVVNWPRRIVVASLWSVFPLLLLSAVFVSDEPAARGIGLVLVIPALSLWVWLWCWSTRLTADAEGIRICSWLPWVRRWSWGEVDGFRVVSKPGQLPVLTFAALEIALRRGGTADAGEISQLGDVNSAVMVREVADRLESMRQRFSHD